MSSTSSTTARQRWACSVVGALLAETSTLPLDVAKTRLQLSPGRGRLAELAAVSRRSGGVERVDLSDVWRAPRPTAFQGLRRWLLPLLAAAIVLEALASRTGWSLRPARR